ncbi:MAG: substrate-binding domain-containing protein [Candidatus Heteroscillospira sp.]|jgi:ribose transport system substrate-binding protein
MRNIMKKLSLFLALVLMLSLVATGCGGGEKAPESTAPEAGGNEPAPEAKTYKIGFSNSFSGNAWRATMLASLDQEAQKHDNIELIIVDGQNDINKQVSDIENLISQGVDAIMCIPGSAQAVEPALKEARANGIKVAIFNMPLTDKEAYDIYIGTDMADKSDKLTHWLGDKLGGEGKIVMLGGPSGNSGTAIWREVADKILAEEYPNIEVLQYRDTDWKEDKAKQVMTDLLLAYPGEIDGIWCDGGQTTAGAMKAMLAAGNTSIPITGNSCYNSIFGMYDDLFAINPDFDFAITPEPIYQSRICLQQVIKLLDGEEQEQDQIIDVPVYTGENADMYDERLPDNMFTDHDLTDENLNKLLNSDSF